jgi:hypothetical protein
MEIPDSGFSDVLFGRFRCEIVRTRLVDFLGRFWVELQITVFGHNTAIAELHCSFDVREIPSRGSLVPDVGLGFLLLVLLEVYGHQFLDHDISLCSSSEIGGGKSDLELRNVDRSVVFNNLILWKSLLVLRVNATLDLLFHCPLLKRSIPR